MFASVSMNRDNLFGGQFGGDCFPGGTVVKKKSICQARDVGLIPALGRSPGVGNGNPLQYP